jgi:hypothetical protein
MNPPEPHVLPAGSSLVPPGHEPPPATAPSVQLRRASDGGAGIASLVISVAASMSLIVTVPLSLMAALLTRPDTGRGQRDWVAPLVLWSLPVVLGLLALSLGIAAVRRSSPGSNNWTAAIAGLWISGLHAAAALTLVLAKGDLMILF